MTLRTLTELVVQRMPRGQKSTNRGSVSSSRTKNVDAPTAFSNAEIKTMVAQLEDMRKLGLNSSETCGSDSSSFIPYEDIVSKMNKSAECLHELSASASLEADELCEQLESFTSLAHDWKKQSEAQYTCILDKEVQVAKMLSGLIDAYQPKALDTMNDVLAKLNDIVLDSTDTNCDDREYQQSKNCGPDEEEVGPSAKQSSCSEDVEDIEMQNNFGEEIETEKVGEAVSDH